MDEKQINELAEKVNNFADKKEDEIIKTKNMPLTNSDSKYSSLVEYSENESNGLVNALMDNSEAIKMAKDQYKSLRNQKDLAKGMNKVVTDKAKADIETAHLKVNEQKVNNKITRAEQRNKLIQLNAEKKYLEREANHKLQMQKFKQIKEKNYDLLLRYFRAKHKDENGKWVYESDAEGNPIIHMPSRFGLAMVRFFDSLTATLNQIADAVGGLNKVVFKGIGIVFILLLLFVPPFRQWLLGLIGINL